MTKYVTLLRGINVGGKLLKMSDLQKVLTDLGLTNVKTLLASGNVVFETTEKNSKLLNKKIAETLEKKFGFPINILLRTMTEIQNLVKKDPFKEIIVNPETRLYVTFLSEKPASKLKIPYENSEKDLKIVSATSSEICTVITISQKRNTTDMMGFVEKEFGKKITTRNWNTVKKIASL